MVLIRAYVSQLEVFRRLPVMAAFVDRLARHAVSSASTTGARGCPIGCVAIGSRRWRSASTTSAPCSTTPAASGRRSSRSPTAVRSAACSRLRIHRGRSRWCSATHDPGSPGLPTTRGASVRTSSSRSWRRWTRVGERHTARRPTPFGFRSGSHRSRRWRTGTSRTCVHRPARATQWPPSGCSTNPTSGRSSTRSACRRSSSAVPARRRTRAPRSRD